MGNRAQGNIGPGAESVPTPYYEAFACLEWGLFMAHARERCATRYPTR